MASSGVTGRPSARRATTLVMNHSAWAPATVLAKPLVLLRLSMSAVVGSSSSRAVASRPGCCSASSTRRAAADALLQLARARAHQLLDRARRHCFGRQGDQDAPCYPPPGSMSIGMQHGPDNEDDGGYAAPDNTDRAAATIGLRHEAESIHGSQGGNQLTY